MLYKHLSGGKVAVLREERRFFFLATFNFAADEKERRERISVKVERAYGALIALLHVCMHGREKSKVCSD